MANFNKEKKQGLHGWFSRNNGKGWIDCKRSRVDVSPPRVGANAPTRQSAYQVHVHLC